MRTVKVSTSGADGLIEVVTAATTWAELKSDMEDAGISTDGMKGVVRETKVSLEANDAQIPEGNFTVMLFTGKIKSGAFDHAQMMRDLRDSIETAYNEVIENIDCGAYGEDEPERSNSTSSLEAERRKLEREFSGQ